MFQPRKLDPNYTLRASKLIQALINTQQLLLEAEQILRAGERLLKQFSASSRLQLDKILMGTIFLALARHDHNHPPASHLGLPGLTTQISALLAQVSPEQRNMQALVHYIGEEILIKQSIAFSGEFSSDEAINSLIKMHLPYKKSHFSRYFENSNHHQSSAKLQI